MDRNTSVTKIEYNSIHRFLTYGVQNVFGTHSLTLTNSLTDSLTDRKPRKQNASGTVLTLAEPQKHTL